MYAGAAREAVFAVPAVVKRIAADFVPLALRAPAVNQPQSVPDEDERWLYERINRAKLAPQGICVLDAKGQVLIWVQMFDSNKSVLDFLDHGMKRFQEKDKPVLTQRFLRFPGEKMADLQDKAKIPAVPAAHAEGKRCAADDGKGKVVPGSLRLRLVGRALDEQGKPVPDTVKQEHYVEDQFSVTPDVQKQVSEALAKAGAKRVRLPGDFSRLCASHAHLGHIDVKPCLCMIKGKVENKGDWKRCELWAKAVSRQPRQPEDGVLWQLDGQSEVVSAVAINGDGVHNVKLAWEGFIEVQGDRIVRLVLSARGSEKLQFAKDHPLLKIKKDEVAFLPGGRPVDQESGVRYGITSQGIEPVSPPGRTKAAPVQQEQIPDEARKQLVEALGGPFIVFRDKVQEELKLGDEKKQKLMAALPEYVKVTMELFEKLQDAKPPEREKAMQEHRRKSEEKLSVLLKDVLGAKEQERLVQLQLQQAGAFALLGDHKAFAKLKITAEQRKQFMAIALDMQKKIEPIIKEAESGGSAAEIFPKIMKVRRDHESRIEAALSDTQKQEWRKLLGKPFELDR